MSVCDRALSRAAPEHVHVLILRDAVVQLSALFVRAASVCSPCAQRFAFAVETQLEIFCPQVVVFVQHARSLAQLSRGDIPNRAQGFLDYTDSSRPFLGFVRKRWTDFASQQRDVCSAPRRS